jgi:hypothetical protein
MAVIPADKLKDDFLGLQNSIRGGAIGELLDTFVYGLLLVLRGNSIVTKSVS